jgi:hypothetical protein
MAKLFRHPTDPDAASEYQVARATHDQSAMLAGDALAWPAAATISWGADDYRTVFRALWTEAALFVRFDCADDAPWWTMSTRDAALWEEEVVEIFLDPAGKGGPYAEVEVNPANVVCDLKVNRPWPSLSGELAWNWEGLQSRVITRRDGRQTKGWTVTMAMPFEGVRSLGGEGAFAVPPRRGDRWRFNVFRIKRPGGPADRERGAIYAAWSVPDGPSFHDPSRFRDLVFT